MPLAGLIRAQTCDGPAEKQAAEPCAPSSSANSSRKPGWWTHHPSATLIVVPRYWLSRESFLKRPLGSASQGSLFAPTAAAPEGRAAARDQLLSGAAVWSIDAHEFIAPQRPCGEFAPGIKGYSSLAMSLPWN